MLARWAYGAIYRSSRERTAALDGWLWHYGWKSSMKKRVRVKVRGFVGLDAWPLAAARAVSETLQSSIRPRGAGQSAVRGSGAQSSWRPSRAGEARLSCELARAVRRRGRGRGAGLSGLRALMAPP